MTYDPDAPEYPYKGSFGAFGVAVGDTAAMCCARTLGGPPVYLNADNGYPAISNTINYNGLTTGVPYIDTTNQDVYLTELIVNCTIGYDSAWLLEVDPVRSSQVSGQYIPFRFDNQFRTSSGNNYSILDMGLSRDAPFRIPRGGSLGVQWWNFSTATQISVAITAKYVLDTAKRFAPVKTEEFF